MPLRICFIASEVTPLAKTGGLADVAGALAKYLHAAGHDIRLFMPLYGQVDRSKLEMWPVAFLQDVPLRLGAHALRFSVHTARLPGATTMIYLIDCPQLFERPTIYSNAPDEHLRFIALTHAALLCCQRMGFTPQILHCNDWHTALAPLLLKTIFAWDKLFRDTRSLLTLHNLGYQGEFAAERFADLSLPPHFFSMNGLEFHGKLNFMKAGLYYADRITTVSPGYAREIQTPEFGFGMDGLLRFRSSAVSGILNGVDTTIWNPSTDKYLPARYSVDDMSGKAACKKALISG
jgi:starch synthase